ncbi:MAG: NUDIX hydrolase [Elusimicrobia bacterium]|nr:NUDIX hydrolase [Elusimicrobiota bacterium]
MSLRVVLAPGLSVARTTREEDILRVAVDMVIFSVRDGAPGAAGSQGPRGSGVLHSRAALKVLLVRRGVPPFAGRWAIPGGFLKENEGLEEAAKRELREETGVSAVYLEQLYTFGDPGRDPRGRVLSVGYMALLRPGEGAGVPTAGGDAAEAAWFDAHKPPSLAFDHSGILDYARQRLRWKLEWTTAGFGLVPKCFTLTELQRVFEAVLGRDIDKRNFRRKVLGLGVLRATKETRREGLARPARVFEFLPARFEKLRERGVLFPF